MEERPNWTVRTIMKSEKGFTLVEVLIAIMLLAVFSTVYVTSQGNNILNSSIMREDALLARLCEEVINEIIINPPQFSASLTLAPETKSFEQSAYGNYEYTIEYKELEVPDIAKLVNSKKGKDENESKNRDNEEGANEIEKMILDQVQKNLKTMIYQVSVTVKNKKTNFNYTLSTWLSNNKAKIQVGL